MIIPATREDFVREIIRIKPYKVGIEVGVREGFFSRFLLENTNLSLFGVDIQLLPSAIALEEEFWERYSLHYGRSPGFASFFENGSLDFVYIDADHTQDAVKEDLRVWWPKVSRGGCLCGDDYAHVDHPVEGRYGVVEAVNEFMAAMGLAFFVTGTSDDSSHEKERVARENGERTNLFHRGLPHEPFTNPTWYCFKD